MNYKGVWTLAELHEGKLRAVSFELLARGKKLAEDLGEELVSVVIGKHIPDVALMELIFRGADRVITVMNEKLGDFIVETYSNVLCGLIRERHPAIVLAAATSSGRTLMPHAAMRLHAGLTADCTGLTIDEATKDLLQTRPAIGGNILATIKSSNHRPQMATVRPKSTRLLQKDTTRTGEVEHVAFALEWFDDRVKKLGTRIDEESHSNIQESDVVISGGRGMKKAENFKLLHQLAGHLGGVVGASRDAVDRGWMKYPQQIGLSGKTVTPKFYVAAGISGSIQHLAGMKTSDIIVAINSDEDAAIFHVADFGIVGDLFEILPLLNEKLEGGGKAMKYGEVTPEIIRELEGIVGPHNVIYDEERMQPYSHDETPAEQFSHMPGVVVKPNNTQQIVKIVKLAVEHLIPVTPRGAGTGLSGGAIPIYGGILLSVEKMNKVIEIDYANMMIIVESGLLTNEINELVADQGLFFAGYPMSLESCFVGGNIAENAGGGKAVKYGVTGQYVMGLEMVTPEGEILTLGGKNVKDVTGYDLKKLIIGSEGTLGIVTKAIIKLTPLPKFKSDLLVLFPDVASAIATVPLIFSKGGITPTSIEFMDKLSVHTSCSYLNEHLPYQQAGSMLLIEVDGTNQEQVDTDAERIGELLMENGAMEVYIADNYTTQERVWSVRRNIAEAFKAYSPHQSLEDIVVPIAAIPELISGVDIISKKYHITMPTYGHAGDGNLHTTLVKNPDSTMEEWYEAEDKILVELYEVVRSLGGKISGEHGIGIKRKKYMEWLTDPVEMKLMKRIKQAFDPYNIMNPGKMFD